MLTEHTFFCLHPKFYLRDITQDVSSPDTFHEYEAIVIAENNQFKTKSCDTWNGELRNRNYLRIELAYFDSIHQRVLLLLRKLVSSDDSNDNSLDGRGRSCTYSDDRKIEFVTQLLSFPLMASSPFTLDFNTATVISFQNQKVRPRQILGLVNGCLVMSVSDGANAKTSILMERFEKSCEFDLIKIIKLPEEQLSSRTHISDPWLLSLPNQQFALCVNNQAFLYNETRRTFDTVIRILDQKRKESIPLASSLHQQSFYDHFDAQEKYASLLNSYELVVTENRLCWQLQYNQNDSVIYRSVLQWMPEPSKVCAITELNGVIITGLNSLIHLESQIAFQIVIYFPHSSEIIPIYLTESDRTKKSKLSLDTLEVKCLSVRAIYYCPNVGIVLRDNSDELHLISIEKVQNATKLPLSQFVDFGQIEQDSKFQCYSVTAKEKEGFLILPLTKLPDHMQNNAFEECKEFAFVKTRGYDSVEYNNYILIAGYKCQQNLPFNEVKSNEYKELATFSELGNYIGAPIFYASDYGSNIQLGCIIGFNKHQRSSNSMCIGQVSQGSSGTSHLSAEGCKWIGIVKHVGDTYFEKKNPVHSSSSIPDKDYFEIVSNKAILADPCNDRNWIRVILPNVKNGKWLYKTQELNNSVHQLLAYHESVTLLKEEEFAVPKELYSYWEDDLGNPCETTSRKISDNLRNQVYSVHAYPTLPSWHKVWVGVGVDTARAGIFDESHYYDESIAPKYKEGQVGWLKHFQEGYSDNAWSKMIDEKTENASVTDIPFGVISSSGYGDGNYQSIVKIDPPTKEIVAIRIIYISNIDQ